LPAVGLKRSEEETNVLALLVLVLCLETFNLVNLEITQTCGSDSPWAWGEQALLVRDVRKPQSINKIAKFGLEMLEGRASFSVWWTGQRWQRLQSIKKIA
jgi:hypothetical protein